jgi:hypothetical protein
VAHQLCEIYRRCRHTPPMQEEVMDEEEEEQAWERDRLGLREGECSYK